MRSTLAWSLASLEELRGEALVKSTGVAAALVALATIANAQVHRCIDANGRATYSDTACPTSAKRTDQVLGGSATARRDEPENAG